MATINQIKLGLEILSKYTDADVAQVDAQHDEICCEPIDLKPDQLEDSDRTKLDELGWFWDEDEEKGWCSFT